MAKRIKFKFPLVRRSSHLNAMEQAAIEHAARLQTLQDELLQSQRQLFDETHSLQADRDRIHARAERIQIELQQLRGEVATLRSLANERDYFEQRAEDYGAEVKRLGAAESKLAQELSKLQAENSVLERRAKNYQAECERLGAETIVLTNRNETLKAKQNELIRELHMSSARDPLFIGTFPRSGTWMLRYFLNFLDHFAGSDAAPDIQNIYDRVTADSHYMLKFGDSDPSPQRISISHWMCPGAFSLPENKLSGFLELLDKLQCTDFQRDTHDKHAIFNPDLGRARILFVFRNPFDVYRSYADIYERRSAMKDRQAYPFNPMTPFARALMNSTSEAPFEHFIDGFAGSGFAEYFIAYFMSFLLVLDAYPETVRILRYEDAMADREKYLRDVVTFGRVGAMKNKKFKAAFDKAVVATDISQMKDYEGQLGHALSGAKTHYGEANSSHMSSKKRNWRDLFSEEDIAFLRGRINEYEPRILDHLPELA